jgi:hypothetical protein
VLGEAGSRVTVVSLPARGRPPQAAARRGGLEVVEKPLTSKSSIVGLLCWSSWTCGSYRLSQPVSDSALIFAWQGCALLGH